MFNVYCRYCGKNSFIDLDKKKITEIECPNCGANINSFDIREVEPTKEAVKKKHNFFTWLFVILFFLFVMGFILFTMLLLIFAG